MEETTEVVEEHRRRRRDGRNIGGMKTRTVPVRLQVGMPEPAAAEQPLAHRLVPLRKAHTAGRAAPVKNTWVGLWRAETEERRRGMGR